MKLLDLFCSAGGAGMGYHKAGFEVVGVDNKPQPRYPFEFHQADALAYLEEHGKEFDVIHGSPPCQKYSKSVTIENRKNHPALIEPLRDLLIASGRLYIIENVPGSPLIDPMILCGTMFGLDVKRHRLFETNFPITALECRHDEYEPKYPPAWNRKNKLRFVAVSGGWQKLPFDVVCKAMGIGWMNKRELSEAIPPAYTEFIGGHLAKTAMLDNKACTTTDKPGA
jgi:DNA (cytosine-5)-methyltransferase 1